MATTYTPNYHLGKQEDRSDKFLMQVITENMDIIDEQLKATDDKATAAAAGLKYKGAVNYYSDLPNDAEIGDAYTVLYAGSSGIVPDGTEYVWGELNGTAQWIDFSKDSYTKAEVNALLAAKQSLLSATNKLNPAYIDYDSTHAAVTEAQRAQISTNQTNIGKVQTQANWNTNNGVKNLIKPEMVQAGEYNSVTYTVNSDGSITVNGTATGGTSYVYISINNRPMDIKQFCDGNHILTGCPSGGSAAGYKLYAAKGNYAKFDYGDGVLLTGTTETEVFLVIAIPQGVTANNLVFRPMVRPALITDDTFEPYALPNTKITPELIELVDSGAKNLIPVTRDEIKSYNAWTWNGYTATNGGITFTLNEDMSITMNGTSTSIVELSLLPRSANRKLFKSAGTYELQCKVPANSSWFVGVNRTVSGSSVNYGIDNGSGLEFTVGTSDVSASNGIWIGIPQGAQISDVTIYPMICTKAAWDVSQKYVPYAPTNAELYAMIQALQS